MLYPVSQSGPWHSNQTADLSPVQPLVLPGSSTGTQECADPKLPPPCPNRAWAKPGKSLATT